jgi:hypothetical protein
MHKTCVKSTARTTNGSRSVRERAEEKSSEIILFLRAKDECRMLGPFGRLPLYKNRGKWGWDDWYSMTCNERWDMKEDGDVEQEALHVWPLVIGTTDWSKGRMIQDSKEVWKCHTGLKSSESVYLHGKTSEGQLPLREWSSSYNSSKGPRVSVPK